MLSFFNRSPRCSVSLWKPWGKWGKLTVPCHLWSKRSAEETNSLLRNRQPQVKWSDPRFNPEYGLLPLPPRESNLDVYVCVSDNTLHTTDSYLLHGDPPWPTSNDETTKECPMVPVQSSILPHCLCWISNWLSTPSPMSASHHVSQATWCKSLLKPQIICFPYKVVFSLGYPYNGANSIKLAEHETDFQIIL